MNKSVKQFNWWAVIDKNGKVQDVVNTRQQARNFCVEDGDQVIRVTWLVLKTKPMLYIPWVAYGSLEGRK
jgi:hypothetical protein